MPSPSHVLKDYLICVSRLPRLEGAVLDQVVRSWRDGDPAAQRRLHEALLAEVVRCVLPYRASSQTFQRLIEAGNCGLAKALRDPRALDAPDLIAWVQSQVTLELGSLQAAKPRR